MFRTGHGLIALDVHVNLGSNRLSDLAHALGAAAMRGRGHLSFSAVLAAALDNLVGIGGYDDFIQQRG